MRYRASILVALTVALWVGVGLAEGRDTTEEVLPAEAFYPFVGTFIVCLILTVLSPERLKRLGALDALLVIALILLLLVCVVQAADTLSVFNEFASSHDAKLIYRANWLEERTPSFISDHVPTVHIPRR